MNRLKRLDRLQRWILGIVVVLAAGAVFVAFLASSYVPLQIKPTPDITPIVISPTPSVSRTTVTTPPSTVEPSTTPSSSEPTVSSSPSKTPTPSVTSTPTPSPSTTTVDPTANWTPAVDCVPGVPGEFVHLGQCKVKGKTPLQVLETCRAAARGWMSIMSGGTAGSKADAVQPGRSKNVATCLSGFGLKVIDVANVEGCPLKCSNLKSRDGLQYILLTGGIRTEGGYNELPVLFDAATGAVIQDENKINQLNEWNAQFEQG